MSWSLEDIKKVERQRLAIYNKTNFQIDWLKVIKDLDLICTNKKDLTTILFQHVTNEKLYIYLLYFTTTKMSYKTIANLYDISSARVGQIINEVRKEVKHPKVKRQLRYELDIQR